jgi:hypothetical protein
VVFFLLIHVHRTFRFVFSGEIYAEYNSVCSLGSSVGYTVLRVGNNDNLRLLSLHAHGIIA